MHNPLILTHILVGFGAVDVFILYCTLYIRKTVKVHLYELYYTSDLRICAIRLTIAWNKCAVIRRLVILFGV